ncbi:MAG: arginine decarboxylase, pyruvoyl-dependent [Desulfobacterales bacterium]|jgi:arginine decarboxylase|nr:arginine decarboxylase, pyruvoyl-dependent [Desulfobacterales bacterium]MDD3082684.1 arginine decarboxylase, pyruvoyl-dependent [Desulfobacterales bacterium]MDD3949720.1 arginine decarboxylase, pyruvoyl-dependent [Desulfobacterales bacterium]MDD4464796.1 arginine decarboxylase, pyruvoyl-dependent [Desulfobacterales bacterium]MDY0376932.1 arginine decarboxylase, pyruvoyl-dependent [Desulfobacterales bacterium]
MYVPRYLFFTKGVGVHREKLASFENALRNARIAHLNLVMVSSIFPPHCKIFDIEAGLSRLEPGEITHCVMAREQINEAGRRVVASIGLAIPAEPGRYGYLSEHHGFGQTELEAGEYAEDLAASMLANTLGIEFDPDKDYDERREVYSLSGKIVESQHISQAALGAEGHLWTTVLAAAVFVK